MENENKNVCEMCSKQVAFTVEECAVKGRVVKYLVLNAYSIFLDKYVSVKVGYIDGYDKVHLFIQKIL